MKKTLASLAAACLIASPALALEKEKPQKPDKKPTPEQRFERLDKNGDKKLSVEEFVGKRKDEAKEKAEKAFARKDKNKDKSLTLEEFKAKAGKPKPKKPE